MDIYGRILKTRGSLTTIDRPTKPIGSLLKELIDMKGMNPYSLARSSGVSHSQIVRILHNKAKRPKFETMVAFCIGLELTYYESMRFFRDAGYYDFENENRLHNDMVLYTMILQTPGIDLVHANILLILGMYELINHECSISQRPSLVPSYLTATDYISRKYPQVPAYKTQMLLDWNIYTQSDEIRDIIEKLRTIEKEWEATNYMEQFDKHEEQ